MHINELSVHALNIFRIFSKQTASLSILIVVNSALLLFSLVEKQYISTFLYLYHRRRIKTEAKAKVVVSV